MNETTPYGFTAEACSTRLAQRLGARCLNLHAPAILSRAALAAELREEPILKAQLDQLQTVNKLLFSVGTATSLESPPASSSIFRMPNGRHGMTTPGCKGNGVTTSTSTGSPSAAMVCGT